MSQTPKVIIALDYPNPHLALDLVKQLDPQLCRLKVGKQLFVSSGSELVKHLVSEGFDVFLDLKFHDIPSTVAKACLAAYELGVWMVNVHCSGGRRMLQAAAAAYASLPSPKPLLIGVTVLTSLTDQELMELGYELPADRQAVKLASLAKSCGLDGIVCSAQEASAIKQQHGQDFLCVTPGIRLATSLADDQHRVMTPQQAIAAGADYLVIGRPITQADNPLGILQKINIDINI